MPDWIPRHMAGGFEANGTFAVTTQLGCARVHPGNVVIEHRGTVWVRTIEEVAEFIENLNSSVEPAISSVGPGKVHQFGTISREKKAKKELSMSSNRHQRYSPTIGSPPTIEWIDVKKLSIDGLYQRSTDNASSRRLITSIAAKFDWRLCAPLVVSRRANDTLTIIDGQHRWLAACSRGDIPHLPCCIFRYDSAEEEARMFILANRARKAINRLDDYFAALAAADEDALEIEQIVTGAGLRVSRNTSATAWLPGEIAFTSAIADSIRKFGSELTSAILTNMAEAFPNQKMTHGGAIFGGLLRIMSRPESDFDPDRLMSVLQTQTADQWGSYAAGLLSGDRRAAAVQQAVMNVYDKITSDVIA